MNNTLKTTLLLGAKALFLCVFSQFVCVFSQFVCVFSQFLCGFSSFLQDFLANKNGVYHMDLSVQMRIALCAREKSFVMF